MRVPRWLYDSAGAHLSRITAEARVYEDTYANSIPHSGTDSKLVADCEPDACAHGIPDGDADATANCSPDACTNACTHQAHHCTDGRTHSRAVACTHRCTDEDPCELRAQRLVRVDTVLPIVRWRPPVADSIDHHRSCQWRQGL